MKILTRKKENEIKEQLQIISQSTTTSFIYSSENDPVKSIQCFNEAQDAIFKIYDILSDFYEYVSFVYDQSEMYDKVLKDYEKWKQDNNE